ncbi:uncharacterized protein LOC120340987 [Styela clava]
MDVHYHGDTDSVRYLTTSAETSSSLRSYGLSRISSLWSHTRSMPRDRLVVFLALVLSFSAFLLSIASYVDRPRGHQISDAAKLDVPREEIHFPTFNYSSTTSLFENESYSGSGSGMSPEISNDTFIEVLSDLTLELAGDEMINWETSLISNITDQLRGLLQVNENRTLHVADQIQSLKHSHRLSKSQLEDLNVILNQIQDAHVNNSESIADLKIYNENSFRTILGLVMTSQSLLRDLAVKAHVQKSTLNDLENVLERKTNSLENTINVLNKERNMTTSAILSIQDHLDQLRSQMNSQKIDFQSEITDLTDKINQCLTKTQGNANANHVMKSQIQSLKTSATSLSYNPAQLTQLESRLTSAIQGVRGKGQMMEAKLHSLSKSVHDIDLFRFDANATITNMKLKLQRKANRGWIQAPNGYEYHVTLSEYTKWEEAKAKCVFLEGKLAHIGVRDTNMHNFIFTNVVEPRGRSAWIGLTDNRREGSWVWLDGHPLQDSEAYWAVGQPNNIVRYNKDQDCAEIDIKDGQWTDLWCSSQTEPNAALCERKSY